MPIVSPVAMMSAMTASVFDTVFLIVLMAYMMVIDHRATRNPMLASCRSCATEHKTPLPMEISTLTPYRNVRLSRDSWRDIL